jgi:hypothetical protein
MSISTHQEAVMSNTVPPQHPAVVLRSHYRHLRSLLAVAVVAVVGLSGTVVVLALDEEGSGTSSVSSIQQPATQQSGPDESAVAAAITQAPPEGGPDESRIAAAIGK